jgi:hypothetical protein
VDFPGSYALLHEDKAPQQLALVITENPPDEGVAFDFVAFWSWTTVIRDVPVNRRSCQDPANQVGIERSAVCEGKRHYFASSMGGWYVNGCLPGLPGCMGIAATVTVSRALVEPPLFVAVRV